MLFDVPEYTYAADLQHRRPSIAVRMGWEGDRKGKGEGIREGRNRGILKGLTEGVSHSKGVGGCFVT